MMTAADTFKVVGGGQRRVVAVSPAARPELRLPRAHPRRVGHLGADAAVASCAVERRGAVPSRWLRLKVAAVSVIAVAGGVVSVAQFVAGMQEDVPRGYVAGDPAWAHVTQP